MRNILLFSSIFYFACESPTPIVLPIDSAPSSIGSKEDPVARVAYEMLQLVDPATKQLPDRIFQKELAFARRLDNINRNQPLARAKTIDWTLAGPSNVGGRTRALEVDSRDQNTFLAGGVSGGMWRSTDGGLSWNRTSHPATINGVTCLTQDPRVGKKQTWYYGTGELRGNSARAVQAPYRGDGIFKSVDNGETWEALSPTQNNQLTVFESPFNYVWKLAVNPSRTDIDEVYAAIYGGIVRSQDGGSSWTTVLGEDLINDTSGDLNNSDAPFYTDIMILPSGNMYAYLSTTTSMGNNETNKGIFYSENGTDWQNITPVGFQINTARLVMDYAPTDESTVYMMLQADAQQLWKRKGSLWMDLSNQIPTDSDEMEAYDSQDSYNMVINVHPEDPLIVYLGGTNLYRSMDGFSSSQNTQQIGGYSIENENSLYENHHPDQHGIVFLKGDDEMLSANDGGIYKTFNNRANTMSWVSLNNGYVTSQFYSVAISKTEGTSGVIGGMQDNGTYRSVPNQSAWQSVLSGDGSYCATTPNDFLWYSSLQKGQIYKMSFNSEGGLSDWARVDPIGGDDYLFITPFVLDPNNYHRMYLAVNHTIWRNDNMTQIASQESGATSVNWTTMESTNMHQKIAALDISSIPAHILYYATSTGSLYKVEQSNLLDAVPVEVMEQPGYISSICIDPLRADHILFSCSNYNIPSLFYSEDGGASFVDVGGNLEENEDGAGNGPSVRWVEIIPLNDGSYVYFAATSTGLYSTTALDGTSTTWVKEGESTIGNSVAIMTDYRPSDGQITVATHGNGVFRGTVSNTKEIDKSINVPEGLTIIPGYPNPFEDVFQIRFTISEAGPLVIYIVDVGGKRVKVLLNYPQFQGEVQSSWDGTDDSGNKVQNGLYQYLIYYNGGTYSGKMMLSK